jgi:helicase SWR1
MAEPHATTPARVLRMRPNISLMSSTLTHTPTPSGIKRVTLIVRPPPPFVSHPDQRRPQPKHRNLGVFLRSYTMPDEEVMDTSALEAVALREARILERAHQIKKTGAYLVFPASDSGSTSEAEGEGEQEEVTNEEEDALPCATALNGPRKDLWAALVDDIPDARRTIIRDSSERAATRVAKLVTTHWAGVKRRRDRAADDERELLRRLARETLDAVLEKWREVVTVSSALAACVHPNG